MDFQKINTDFLSKVNDPFYRLLVVLQGKFNELTHLFWNKNGVLTINLPITTGSISSPMGLGSDSTAVSVKLGNVQTYLADSMQFALEYGCRFLKRDVIILCHRFEVRMWIIDIFHSFFIVKQNCP